jgi:outer membrane murein-binding lipoprotein Lpp
MKSSLVMLATVLSVLTLSGCAGMDQKSAYVAPQQVGSNQDRIRTDEAYVAAVERIARRRGVYLQWVNVPTKRIAAVDNQ